MVWLRGQGKKKKKVSSKGNLKTIPSDILSNEITGTWILYQYNWDQIVALHLDFKQACTALWWLILFVAVQPNITRVNRSYYSDLNLVFHGEVGDGDQESSVLGTTVHNCLRCVTRSLNFLWSIKILITAKGRMILLAAHTVLQQELPAQAPDVQSHSFSREGHGLRALSTAWQVTGHSWYRLPSGGFCWRMEWASPSLSSLAALFLASLCTSSVALVWICGAQPPFCLTAG